RAQAAWMDPDTGTVEILSDAPHLVMDPVPLNDGSIAFLNREGWSFSLDTLPLPEAPVETGPPQSSDAKGLAEASSSPSEREGDGEASPDEAQGAEELTDAADAPSQTWVRDSVSGVRLLDSEEATEQPVEVLRDGPYLWWDDRFVPQLRIPLVSFSLPAGETSFENLRARLGIGLQGADRLGRHNWVLDGYYDTLEKQLGGTVGYVNHQLAPWTLWGTLSRLPLAPRTDWTLRLNASRSFWTTPVSFSLLGFHLSSRSDEGPWMLGLIGPRVAVDYFAGDSTLDGGTQRGFGVSVA